VLLNAAAAIAAHDGVTAATLDAAIEAGLAEAARAIDTGAAAELLSAWVEASQAAKAALS
jgi:anthranilate phosphoribosyltransferase